MQLSHNKVLAMNIIARKFLLVAVGIVIFLLIHSLLARFVLEQYREQRAVSAAVKRAPVSSNAGSGSTGSAEKTVSSIARLNY